MIELASSSPRRRTLLREAGIRYRIVRPDYHERTVPGLKPRALVRVHALGKALSAAAVRPHAPLILAADTVVFFGGKIIGKPRNAADARRILGKLQGNWHDVWTGVALLRRDPNGRMKKTVFTEKTRVRIRKMDAAAIRAYFRRVNPLDKAGAYAIQSKHSIVEEVRGSLTNAVGLPMERLSTLL
jgi:septum formation protein